MLQSFLNTITKPFKRIKDFFVVKSPVLIDVINGLITSTTTYLPALLKDVEQYTNPANLGDRTNIFDIPELKQLVLQLEGHTRGKNKKGFAYVSQAVTNCAAYMALLLGVVEREFDKTTNEASLDTMNYRLGHIVTEIGAIQTWVDYLGLVATMIQDASGHGHWLAHDVRYSAFDREKIVTGAELLLTMSDKFQEDPKRLLDEVMRIEPVQVTKDVANFVNGKTISQTNQMGFVASKVNPLFLLGMVYNNIYLWNLEVMKHRYERAQIQRAIINQMMRDKKLATRDISTLTESEKRELEKLKKQIEFYDVAIAKLERKIREKMEEA